MNIESFGGKVRIDAEDSLLDKISCSDFLYQHIPCANIDECKDYNATLDIKEGPFNVSWEFPRIWYQNQEINVKDVIALSGYLLERLRQENGIYSLHANTTKIKDDAVVIFGPPHVGKTTLSLLLAKELNGYVIANERSVIDKGKIKGRLNQISINKYVKEITSEDEESVQRLVGEGDAKISMFVHPYPSNDQKKVIPYSHDAALWDLIEESDGFIRGINRKVKKGIDSFYMLPSLDTDEIANQRFEDISSIIKKTPCYTIKGDYKDIVSMIGEKLYKGR